MRTRSRTVLGVLALVGATIGWSAVEVDAASGSAIVTNANDSGPGSLRDALASGASHVVISPQVGTTL